ncbi:MAG TPA: beta-galactosidase [Aggregatilineaceae bacterium]|nr:beta-galactosidase [Aggregatilineaceae bacterium]
MTPLEHPFLGVAYYPEHWSEARWADDAKFLREAGITVARMMEFAWDKLEPRPGDFQFEWMDRALGIFADAGIKVILCTPTATPPPWLTKAHPKILRVDDRTGQRAVPGSRRSACANVPAYRKASAGIVTAVAKHWGDHSNVIGWQIDNEFGCHGTIRCICDDCRAAFQKWCMARYQTLDALNAAWGTQFWSATYSAWGEIPAPAPTTAGHNPGLLLDYRRFSSEAWVAYQHAQIAILRPRIGEDRFITHNLMLRFVDMDYFDLVGELDFVGYDNYPYGMSGPLETAFNLDLMRGLKNRAFWVLEAQPGPVNWVAAPVAPGQVRTWSHQAFGHGAEAVCYFRERAVNIGQEQYHSGLMKHDGSPDRGWHEAKQVSDDLARHPVLRRPKAPVAIVFDYQDQWTIELDPYHREFTYYEVALDIYRQLWAAHIPVDVVPRGADLAGYQAVFVPCPALIDERHAANWRAYVEQGGSLVVTFRAFYKNPTNTWTDQPLPAGGLSDLLGVTVDEFLSIPATPQVGLRSPRETGLDWNDERGTVVVEATTDKPSFGLPLPTRARYHTWAEVLKPGTAAPLLRYADGYYRDGVAATVNKVGQGSAYYLGCWGEAIIPHAIWTALALDRLGVNEKHEELEIIRLEGAAGEPIEMRINHTKRTVSVTEGAKA